MVKNLKFQTETLPRGRLRRKLNRRKGMFVLTNQDKKEEKEEMMLKESNILVEEAQEFLACDMRYVTKLMRSGWIDRVPKLSERV
jgi:tetraacyldisaccharide-1-P 4'-kinase